MKHVILLLSLTITVVWSYAQGNLSVTVEGNTLYCQSEGLPVTLSAVVQGGSGDYRYHWNPQDDTLRQIVLNNPLPGEYGVTVTDKVTGEYISASVEVQSRCPISIPNIITANNDGINDVFYIKNIEMYPDNEIFIYSRSGDLVYHEKNYANNWTADNMPGGTYFYIIDNKIDKPAAGFLTLVR